ncbi:hypothetical protein [Agromyces sp. GXS1127]|uniref:hypothetical protein n=1 Tax=Agromyces sp. GXS1127 TaxID=3424181 RepID=UPI003D31D1B4
MPRSSRSGGSSDAHRPKGGRVVAILRTDLDDDLFGDWDGLHYLDAESVEVQADG